MSKFELTDIELAQLSQEQRLKITQGIVDDLVRALNLGNYSLIWRYLSDDFSQELDAEHFKALHESLMKGHGSLGLSEQQTSVIDNSVLIEEWQVTTDSSTALLLTLCLRPVREFFSIEQLEINPL